MYSNLLASLSNLQDELNAMPGVEQPGAASGGELEDAYSRLITDYELKRNTEKLFRDGHHARAVEEGFKYLDNVVKKEAKLGEENISGAQLMNRAFSSNSPLLRINDGKTQSEIDEQQGYHLIFAGSMTGIRNPRAHESGWEDSEKHALELLTLANHLVEKAKTSIRV